MIYPFNYTSMFFIIAGKALLGQPFHFVNICPLPLLFSFLTPPSLRWPPLSGPITDRFRFHLDLALQNELRTFNTIPGTPSPYRLFFYLYLLNYHHVYLILITFPLTTLQAPGQNCPFYPLGCILQHPEQQFLAHGGIKYILNAITVGSWKAEKQCENANFFHLLC